MKIKNVIMIIFLMLSMAIFGNDWAFSANGEHIIPLEMSNVSIKKEVIRMKMLENGDMSVNVRFTFDSPDARNKLIGFVTPDEPGVSVEDNWNGKMNYENFITKVNGQVVKSNAEKVKTFINKNLLSQEELKKYDIERYKDSYVFFFNANFKKGENIIEHSYDYTPSAGVGYIDYKYVWTTISKWKNQKVNDFELIVELAEGFYVLPYTFNKNGRRIQWQVSGDATIDYTTGNDGNDINDGSEYIMSSENRYFLRASKNTVLRYKTTNFAPNYEFRMAKVTSIKIGVPLPEKTSKGYKIIDKLSLFNGPAYYHYEEDDEIQKLSIKELEIIRNYPYAWEGYDFSRKDLKDYFSQFIWYKPVGKDIKLDEYDLKFIRFIDDIIQMKRKK